MGRDSGDHCKAKVGDARSPVLVDKDVSLRRSARSA